MTHSDLIDLLGGTSVVARGFSTSQPCVSMWRKRGIPWPRRWEFARVAKARGVPLPDGFFEIPKP